MRHLSLFTCFFMILVAHFSEATARPLVSRKDVDFKVWNVADRNISSQHLIIGVHSGDVDTHLWKPVLTLNGINPTDSTICISLDYISGNYFATAEIHHPPKNPAIDVDLPINKTIKKFNYPQWDELAFGVKIPTNDQCDIHEEQRQEYLLPTWGEEYPSRVRFLINPPVGSVVRLILDGKSYPCSDLTVPHHRAIQSYSMSCNAPLPANCQTRHSFELIVSSYGERQPGASGILRRVCP